MASIKGIRARRESCLLMGCGGLVMLSGFWIMYSSSYVRERAMKELTQFCDKFGITTNNPEQHDTFTHACRLQIKYVKKIGPDRLLAGMGWFFCGIMMIIYGRELGRKANGG
jgi:hypothetical protein